MQFFQAIVRLYVMDKIESVPKGMLRNSEISARQEASVIRFIKKDTFEADSVSYLNKVVFKIQIISYYQIDNRMLLSVPLYFFDNHRKECPIGNTAAKVFYGSRKTRKYHKKRKSVECGATGNNAGPEPAGDGAWRKALYSLWTRNKDYHMRKIFVRGGASDS